MCDSLSKFETLLKARIKTKKIHGVFEFNQLQCLKPYIDLNTQKRIEGEKNGEKDGKVSYKLINNAVCPKTIENLRNRIDVKLVNNEKDYLKCTPNPSYILHKIFDNNWIAIRQSKVSLKINKPAYTGMCVLELRKVLVYEFHYDSIENKYENK